MSVELLSPAGDYESAVAAINSNADAIYLGLKEFSARKSALNFNLDEIEDLLKYTKVLGVKIYVAVNTLISEKDFPKLLKILDKVYLLGVDALIVQDYGLLNILIKRYPDMEIHLSTQVNVTNIDELKHFENLGTKQVVLARELNTNKIKELKDNSSVKLETFIHGAICVAYSGNCLFSSSIGERSGNKGDCAQPCRKKYKLYKENQELDYDYLLSPKEMMTAKRLKEIIDTGVDSLKIEGRLKGQTYSGHVTKEYHNKIIDNDYVIDEKKIKKIFNRQFTDGYILDKDSKNIINKKTNNHLGVKIGEIIDKNNTEIKVKLIDKIAINDGVRINQNFGFIVTNIKKDNTIVKEAKEGEIVTIKVETKDVKIGDVLYITKDKSLELNEKTITRKKTINVEFYSDSTIMYLKYKDIVVKSNEIEIAKNRANTTDEINKQLTKTSRTPYEFIIDFTGKRDVFINNKELNKLRQIFIEELNNYFIKNKRVIVESSSKFEKRNKKAQYLEVVIDTKEQLEVVKKYKFDKIYTRNVELVGNDVFYSPSRVLTKKQNLVDQELLVSDYSHLKKGNKLVASSYLNAYNSETVKSLIESGFERVYLSHELSTNDIISMNLSTVNDFVGITIYSKIDLMITKSCPIKNHFDVEVDCGLCKKNQYYLVDEYKNKMPLIRSDECNIRIISWKAIDKIDEIDTYRNLGISNFLLDFTTENAKTTEKIIEKFINRL